MTIIEEQAQERGEGPFSEGDVLARELISLEVTSTINGWPSELDGKEVEDLIHIEWMLENWEHIDSKRV